MFSYPNFTVYSQKKHNCKISCYHFSINDVQRWFKSNIRHISGCEYFTEMMELEDRFLAQNRPKIFVQVLVFRKNQDLYENFFHKTIASIIKKQVKIIMRRTKYIGTSQSQSSMLLKSILTLKTAVRELPKFSAMAERYSRVEACLILKTKADSKRSDLDYDRKVNDSKAKVMPK